MEQFDWLVGGGSSGTWGVGNGGGSGSDGQQQGQSMGQGQGQQDDWLHLSHLMLEALDDDDGAEQERRASSSGDHDQLLDAPALTSASGHLGNHALASSSSTPATANHAAHLQQQLSQPSIADIAIATQQAILASSLLANHHYLASLQQAASGNPLSSLLAANSLMPFGAMQTPMTSHQQINSLTPPNHSVASSSTANLQAASSSSSSSGVVSNADRDRPIKTESEMDKRRRNTEASARFRAKKKMKQEEMEQTTRILTDRVDVLETRVYNYEVEILMLRRALAGDGTTDNDSLRMLYRDNGVQFTPLSSSNPAPTNNTYESMFGSGGPSGLSSSDRRNSAQDLFKNESLTDLMGLEAPQHTPHSMNAYQQPQQGRPPTEDSRIPPSSSGSTPPSTNKRQRKK
ncbi:hypothetical protein BJ741DRAFT_602376 [Chytriomyces cf. hyalinus JEL632]|nr:hypothetical protein BJ741DRAFT_602376 [Chytriomyces cf. hyalinus JEL632]